jgi:hypothetical protein
LALVLASGKVISDVRKLAGSSSSANKIVYDTDLNENTIWKIESFS